MWSGGDLSHNLNEFILNNLTGTCSTEWSSNKINSFKFTSNGAIANFQLNLTYKIVNDTLTASFTCLNPNSTWVVKFYQLYNSSVLNARTMNVYASNNPQNISISTTTLENITSIRLLIESSNNIGSTIFIDDVKLCKR